MTPAASGAATPAPLHPAPQVDALWRLGLEATSPIVCSAGRTGFYIDANGDTWKCGALSSALPPLGNVLRDGRLPFAERATCERYPTRQANPGAELQCWCIHNQVLETARATPADLEGLYDRAFFHVDVSRLCNFGCHYCTVPAEVFHARHLAKKREHLSPWSRKAYMDADDLRLVAREIFAHCRNVQLRIGGLMEPLMNPDIGTLFEACRSNLDRVEELVLISNLGVARTFDDILDMGFGARLRVIVSLHVVDDNFDPFRVARQMRRAMAMGVRISGNFVPSPQVRDVMADYLDFFSLHGLRVTPASYIVDDPQGRPLEKGTCAPDHVPRSHAQVRAFLGAAFSGDAASRSQAAYVEQVRALNADAYAALARIRDDEARGRRSVHILKAVAA